MLIIFQMPQEGDPSLSIRSYHILFKLAISSLLIAGLLTYRFLFPATTPACIYDAYQEATLNANRAMVVDASQGAFTGNGNSLSVLGKALIGAGQVLIDGWIGVFGLVWLIKIKNARPLVAFALFFVVRGAVFLNVESFPYPDNIAWKTPGFFSLTVPYDRTRDFFYSGHTGTLTIIFLQMCLINYRVLAVSVFICLLFMMNMLLISQVHYTADVIGGLVFSVWFYRTAIRIVPYADKFLSLPFWLAKKAYQICKEEGEAEQKEREREREKEVQMGVVITERSLRGEVVEVVAEG